MRNRTLTRVRTLRNSSLRLAGHKSPIPPPNQALRPFFASFASSSRLRLPRAFNGSLSHPTERANCPPHLLAERFARVTHLACGSTCALRLSCGRLLVHGEAQTRSTTSATKGKVRAPKERASMRLVKVTNGYTALRDAYGLFPVSDWLDSKTPRSGDLMNARDWSVSGWSCSRIGRWDRRGSGALDKKKTSTVVDIAHNGPDGCETVAKVSHMN